MDAKTRLAIAGFATSVSAYMVNTLLIPSEGEVNHPYRDSVGVPTIGIGTTAIDGVKVTMNTPRITHAQAIDYAIKDLQKSADAVNACVGVGLTQGELDAYADLAYNIGGRGFCKKRGGRGDSTIVRKIKAGDRKGACHAIMQYKYAGGRVLSGLVTRRRKEVVFCLRDL